MNEMRNPALPAAMTAWTALLGPDRCLAGEDPRARAYADDVGGYARRAIPAVLYPETPAEVQAVVRVANAHRTPLYAVSTGKNWGLGSRQPVESDGIVVDLHRLDRIRTVNVDEGYAVVEPGVTQQALSDALASTAYIANLTASTPETSVVGNLLDKGIGLHRHRVEDLLGAEVVTGEGELLQVGGHWPTGISQFHFPSGLGPTLTPLFLQSNFGIVTACVIKLLARPESLRVLYATVPADKLVPALAVLRSLRREHALDSVIKLYNAHAFHAYSGQPASSDDRTYHLVAAVHGSKRWVDHTSPFVADTLRQARCFDDVAMLDEHGIARAPVLIQALGRILAGTPTTFAVQRALGLQSDEECRRVDHVARKGLIFIIPIVPLRSDAVLKTLGILHDFSKRYHTAINATINILSEHAVEMVSSIIFDRAGGGETAHTVKSGLLDELRQQDIPLMRLDLDSQRDPELFAQKSYRDALVKLKRAFDPNGILAPGRYIPRA